MLFCPYDRTERATINMPKAKPLTTEQREELARFVEKMKTLVASEQQELIFARAKTNAGRYVINAGPGSGKTTTAIKLSTYFTDTSSIYFSFNKKIQVDTSRKLNALGSKMIASTVHSFGLQCMNDYFGQHAKCQMKDSKYSDLIEAQIARYWHGFFESIKASLTHEQLEKSGEWLYDVRTWSKTLIKYHQLSLSGIDPISLKGLIEQFDLTEISHRSPIWPFVISTVIHAIDQGKEEFWNTHTIDFNDMIYYPALFTEIPVPTYKHIIIDEAQDTSETGLTLILRACDKDTQVFAVGDPKQSVYLFAGAKPDSIASIVHMLKAEVLPLRTCYRCGSNIVDLANQLDGQLIAAGNHEGSVKVIPSDEYLAQLQPKDAVIGRTTARLVKDCLKVLQTGKRAIVLGKNIGDSISGIITKIEARRVSRGISALAYDLSNFVELVDEYANDQEKILSETRKKNPDLAVSEMYDRVDTAKAFYEAYVTKCIDASERRETDPQCEYDRTARDFKRYIKGLFTDDENASIIQFMTAHRSKGLEFERVFIIGTDEFPHPKAKSNQQQRQETNVMYVAITRAINDLYFVDAPFTSVTVPEYEPQSEGMTIISMPPADFLAISPYNEDNTKNHHDEIADANQAESKHLIEHIQSIDDPELSEEWLRKEQQEITKEIDTLYRNMHPHLTLLPPKEEIPNEPPPFIAEENQDAKVGKLLAIEVLCPNCGKDCTDPKTGSLMITEDLIGHTVTCVECHTDSIVPLNAFSLAGNVIAREKPTTGKPNSKVEKKGRTQKERKSNAGRKTKSGIVRQPMQLSLDTRTIDTLNTMGINKSELFETLLQQYEPFLNVYAELGNTSQEDEEEE